MVAYTAPKRRVKTAETTFGIVEALQELGGATAGELAEHTGLATSTVHEHLTTLEHLTYVVNEDGTFRLGLKFLDHGIYAKDQYQLSQIASPTLEHLAKETAEAVCLGVEEHGRVILIEKVQGERAIQTYNRLGRPIPLHCSSSGKAILAHLPQSRVDEIIDRHGLEKRAPNTITDPDVLFTDLEGIRERGVSFNDEESAEGVRAVGGPIVVDGRVVGAIGIPAPKHRMHDTRFREEIPDLVLGATNEIEIKLRHFN